MSIVNSGGPDPVTRQQNWIMIGVAIAGLVVGLVGDLSRLLSPLLKNQLPSRCALRAEPSSAGPLAPKTVNPQTPEANL